MRGNELLDRMELVDAAYVEAAGLKRVGKKQKWVKWGAMAACLCVMFAAVMAIPDIRKPPTIDVPVVPNINTDPVDPDVPNINTDPVDPGTPNMDITPDHPDTPDDSAFVPTIECTLHFNEASLVMQMMITLEGHFWRELRTDEIRGLFPFMPDDFAVSATANFYEGGKLYDIVVGCTRKADGKSVRIISQPGKVIEDVVYDFSEVQISDVYDVHVTAGYWDNGKTAECFSTFEMNGVGYKVYAGGDNTDDELKELVTYFTGIVIAGNMDENAINVEAIETGEIPELIDEKLTLEEARADVDFGAYFLPSAPKGFATESIHRFKDQVTDLLSGLWCKGMDEFRWTVSYYAEKNKNRITAVSETENYDLSLYPIPWADSVPKELREIVNNPIFHIDELTLDAVMMRAYLVNDVGDSPGYRMKFSVLYDDNMVVEVSAKGVSPEWVYEQLMILK